MNQYFNKNASVRDLGFFSSSVYEIKVFSLTVYKIVCFLFSAREHYHNGFNFTLNNYIWKHDL